MAQHVLLTRLSQDMTEGRVVEWLKKEGDEVKEGEPLVSIETEKAVMELQAPASGVLRRILLPSGADAVIGTPLAILAEAHESIDHLLIDVGASAAPPRAGQHVRADAGPAQAAAGRHSGAGSGTAGAGAAAVAVTGTLPRVTGRQPVSPAAKRAARELGVDITEIVGTGTGGMVTEADVRQAASQPPAPAAVESSEDVEVVPLVGVRRRIAERMSLSRRTAADVTTVTDVDMTEVSARRKASSCSYTAYVVWAAARVLRQFPMLNASLAGDQIRIKRNIHVGVAVAAGQGLVVPVVRHADRKTVEEISREIDELAARAQAGQAPPSELTGSTFTVSNSGAFGSLMFTPIINQPEVAIIGMGKVADTPVVRDGQVVVRKVMYLCLSYDHRVVDGGPAVQFLDSVKRLLEELAGA